MKNYLLIRYIFLLLPITVSLSAQDWTQFLGPNRDGTAPGENILRIWPEEGPEILWTTSVKKGYGGPVIKDNKVYLLDRDDDTGDILRCFDFNDGKEIWSFNYDAPGTFSFPGSRSVPTIDGDRIYTCGPYGDLYCIDINARKPIWNKNIVKDFGGTEIPIWAISQCPLIYDDMLIVSYSKDPYAGLVAYNKLTGDIAWKTDATGNETYASPSVANIAGEDHIVMVFSSTNTFIHKDLETTPGSIIGLKPATGEILWEHNNWQNAIQAAPAIDVGDGRIIIVGGYEHGTAMIRIEKENNGKFSVTELFYHNDFGDHTKPPLLIDNHLYAQFSTNKRRDGLCCMNMDGKVLWKTIREPSFDKGSMILADGLILATDGARKLYLVEPDPSGFKPLASAEILETGQNWSPIALAKGKLLIRDQSRILCVKVGED